jgi:RNA polymerase sigma factor (sigma-70 family)
MATAQMSRFLRRLTRGMAAETLAELTDRQLLERFLAAQDEAVFEALVRRHGPMVYHVCWRVLQHAEDTEDAFQATFLLLARKLPTVRKRDSLASWLHGVAHRVALDAKAQVARRHRHEARAAGNSHPGPPEEITWRELRTVLDSELGWLPEKWRLPLILCYLEGRSQEEAALQLGWSKSTLLRRLEEARAVLGRRLARRGVLWPAALSAVLLSDCVALAALAPGLVGSTVEAVACVAAGQAAAGIISAKVAALTKGGLKTMLLTKLKNATAVLLVAIVIGLGIGTTAYQTFAGPNDPKKNETKPAVESTAATPMKGTLVKGTWKEVASLETKGGIAWALAFAPDGKTLAVGGSGSGKVELWDLATAKIRRTIEGQPGQERMIAASVAFSGDGKTLALGGWPGGGERGTTPGSGWVKLCDLATGKLHDLDHGHTDAVFSVAFAPDGKTLATGSWDFTAKLIDVATRKVRWTLARHQSAVRGVAFSPDGKLLASASFDGTVKLWDVATATERTSLGQPVDHYPLFSCVAFSPDGKTVAAGTWLQAPQAACEIYLFEVATGQERSRLRGHAGWIEAVAFSPDGKALASVGLDKAVKIWDLTTEQERATLEGHQSHLQAVAFSPDGKTLASGGHEQTLRLWELTK